MKITLFVVNYVPSPSYLPNLPVYGTSSTSVAEPPLFGLLRLRKSEVPEPAPNSTTLGRLRLQEILNDILFVCSSID